MKTLLQRHKRLVVATTCVWLFIGGAILVFGGARLSVIYLPPENELVTNASHATPAMFLGFPVWQWRRWVDVTPRAPFPSSTLDDETMRRIGEILRRRDELRATNPDAARRDEDKRAREITEINSAESKRKNRNLAVLSIIFLFGPIALTLLIVAGSRWVLDSYRN